ncbi:MAG: hypothetical protein PHT40_02610 [Patescibacteria group bacterium]|nr:hypothetical protein [Patescibacteria group bacterium]
MKKGKKQAELSLIQKEKIKPTNVLRTDEIGQTDGDKLWKDFTASKIKSASKRQKNKTR